VILSPAFIGFSFDPVRIFENGIFNYRFNSG
jgi:hypothetical protein